MAVFGGRFICCYVVHARRLNPINRALLYVFNDFTSEMIKPVSKCLASPYVYVYDVVI